MRGDRTDLAPVQRREFPYGSREFLAASDLARRLPPSPVARALALARSVVRNPALIRVLVAIWRLPVVDLRVRRADIDAWSGAGPVRHGRLAQAVLDLPTAEEHYLSGRPKQGSVPAARPPGPGAPAPRGR